MGETSTQQPSVLRLTHKGRDSWGRPVYEDENGKLWKDVEPREHKPAKLCSVLNNDFDGEPDVSMEVMKKYNTVQVILEPQRDTW